MPLLAIILITIAGATVLFTAFAMLYLQFKSNNDLN
ncbi:MAG: hypothetical protein RL494_804 [Bacteroidota bacterium]|jgi:hypothetical protein